jgi:hypothetical protein
MKPFIVQFSPISYYLNRLRSEYFPSDCVLAKISDKTVVLNSLILLFFCSRLQEREGSELVVSKHYRNLICLISY